MKIGSAEWLKRADAAFKQGLCSYCCVRPIHRSFGTGLGLSICAACDAKIDRAMAGDKHEFRGAFKCPKCGGDRFVMTQTGYERRTPCQLTLSGKKAVCSHADETLGETDGGQLYSRYFDCVKCQYTLTEEDLDEYPETVDLVDAADVDVETNEEDHKDVRTE